MFEMPPQAPPTVPHECVIAAAAHYDVPALGLVLIRLQEGGKPGMANRNTNGTNDYGVMQINTINVDKVSKALNVDKSQLRNDTCTSVYGAAYLLSGHLKDTGGDVWRAIGNYHSKTPRFHNIYLGHVRGHYDRVVTRYGDYVNWLVNASKRAKGRLSTVGPIGPLVTSHGLTVTEMATAGVNTAVASKPEKHPFWREGATQPGKPSDSQPAQASSGGQSAAFRAAFLGGGRGITPKDGLTTSAMGLNSPTAGFDDVSGNRGGD